MKTILACMFVLTTELASGAPIHPALVSTPERTIRAFAKDLARGQFHAMARLVVDAPADSDLARVHKEWARCFRFDSVEVADLRVTIQGDVASARFGLVLKRSALGRAGTRTLHDSVNLQNVKGVWKVRPSGSASWLGGWASVCLFPTKDYYDVWPQDLPVWNHGEDNYELGIKRIKLIRDAESCKSVPYDSPYPNGYVNMFNYPQTWALWSFGQSDEVLFYLIEDVDGPMYLTCWRRVDGRAKREWQVRLPKGKAFRATGACVAWFLGDWLPKGAGKAVWKRIQRIGPLAFYHEDGTLNAFRSSVAWEDGKSSGETDQSSSEADKAGLVVTQEESKVLLIRRLCHISR